MLHIQNLSAGYGEISILHDVSLTLETGRIGVLMGPNGAGKSTLLKSIFNIPDITTGSIQFESKGIVGLRPHELLDRGIAFVSQGRVNFGLLSIRDNLLLGAHHIKDKKHIEEKIAEMYAQFPVLEEKQDQYAFSLSGGEQQMLAIARALMSSPRLLLMDEPSLGLAPKLVKELFAQIIHIRDAFQTSILIVEHNVQSLMQLADDAFILVQGKIVAADRCEVLKDDPIMEKVFVGAFE